MKYLILFLFNLTVVFNASAQNLLSLKSNALQLIWKKTGKGWQLNQVLVKKGRDWLTMPRPSGEGTLLYADRKPDSTPVQVFKTNTGVVFPEPVYRNKQPQWEETINDVSLNLAGEAVFFYYSSAKQLGENSLLFQYETDRFRLLAKFSITGSTSSDVVVKQTLQVKKAGYYSLASPTLTSVTEREIAWATVPGYFQGNTINKDFVQAYAYGMGIPDRPVIYRDRCATTLCPLVSTSQGITSSIIPDPGLSRDPWANNASTLDDWSIGLSHRNRKSELSPTLYFPVLGEPKSQMRAGETLTYGFRYSLIAGDWFKAINHAVYDVYRFKESLKLRQSKQSLSSRMAQMHHYLANPVTSMWKIEDYKGLKIGAQAYLGGAMSANGDAMKNSDYGAMWLLAKAARDSVLRMNVLPYALNFKLAQQLDTGFFAGAVEGQYYLSKKKKFVEEWGAVVEPIGVSYYTMLDMGNILLFEPGNQLLRERLRAGAEFLLRSQKADGSWAVAYDHKSEKEVYRDIPDLRPTFYGLLVAYRILREDKYLAAAQKGADWFIRHAVETGSFLGVCGDARYSPDFATGQSAQALLDLYDITKDSRYRQAAISTAKMYVCSIYTHPVAGTAIKYVKGVPHQDWEISQSGLSFEHGGIMGSANRAGPILLCSHAGLFLRIAELTGEPIFADMARAGAIGRDAFVDPSTGVASYYWTAMNKGAGPYPHHAWWQIGWISDYLLSEAHLRSGGEVDFPRGFVTPKVGPHQTYGFAPGRIYGEPAQLIIQEDLVQAGTPFIDHILASNEAGNRIYVILQNNRAQPTDFILTLKPEAFGRKIARIKKLNGNGAIIAAGTKHSLPGFGQEVIAIDLN